MIYPEEEELHRWVADYPKPLPLPHSDRKCIMSSTREASPVGVIGAGSFGTAVANLLSHNTQVLMYARSQEHVDSINQGEPRHGIQLRPNVRATNTLEELADRCKLLLPIVPSSGFRTMMRSLAPYLHPYHLLIHGTKGFELSDISEDEIDAAGITRAHVQTMSEVIRAESVVVRVGCLSGPNLALEILEGQPTATLIASKFDEVIRQGSKVLKSKQFYVFGSHDLLGAELAGALKNVIALGSGLLKGYGFGKNMQSVLITRGLAEMVNLGRAMGSDTKAFFGTAGIGDLIATATSKKSRNYTFGYRMGQGQSFEEVRESSLELAEGVRTLRISRYLSRYYALRAPITETLYRVVFEGLSMEAALEFLMSIPGDVDVDFI